MKKILVFLLIVLSMNSFSKTKHLDNKKNETKHGRIKKYKRNRKYKRIKNKKEIILIYSKFFSYFYRIIFFNFISHYYPLPMKESFDFYIFVIHHIVGLVLFKPIWVIFKGLYFFFTIFYFFFIVFYVFSIGFYFLICV